MITLGPNDADNAGVSIVSTTSLADDAGRYGSIYDPVRLACGDLRHVHGLPAGRFLLAYGTTWMAATPDNAGGYSAHSDSLKPTTVRTDPEQNGSATYMPVLALPIEARLVGGVSEGDRVFYLTTQPGRSPQLDCANTSLAGTSSMEFSTELPDANGVTWNLGLGIHQGSLLVFGTRNADLAVCVMALPLDAPVSRGGWRYGNGKGWASTPDDIAPLMSVSGQAIGSAGAMTFASYRSKILMTTCSVIGTDVYSTVWMSTHSPFTPWEPQNGSILMGTTTNFLGSGIQLQQSLHANPVSTWMTPPTVGAGIPYCYTTPSANALLTKWGVWPIRRVGA